MHSLLRITFKQSFFMHGGRNTLSPFTYIPLLTYSISVKDAIRPRRAILYVPGHDRRKIEKIASVNVDCAVLDCEDGVAVNKKDDARKIIRDIAGNYDFGKTEFAVRINSIDSGLAEKDLMTVLNGKDIPETLMVPKIESVSHMEWINESLKSIIKFKECKTPLNLFIFIESARSLLDLKEICKKGLELSNDSIFRLKGLVFGSDDFCADIGASRSEYSIEILTARQMFVITAKAFKLQAIDMVHINYNDNDGLRKNSIEGAQMGFTGKQVIHPNQVKIVQKAFSPSPEKIEWAQELIKNFTIHQAEGKGAFTFRGVMIDKPLLLQAEYILKLSEQIK